MVASQNMTLEYELLYDYLTAEYIDESSLYSDI